MKMFSLRKAMRKPRPVGPAEGTSQSARAFNSTLSKLNRKLLEEIQSEEKRLSLFKQQLQQEIDCETQHREEELYNADQVLQQIREKSQKKKQEKNFLGIDPNMNGYPNLPITPSELRKLRNTEKQELLKQQLDDQIAAKTTSQLDSYTKDRALELKLLNATLEDQHNSEAYVQYKKAQERELLTYFWNRGQEVSQLKQQLHSPRQYQQKALKLQEKLIQQGYEQRIKRTIQQSKQFSFK